MTTFEDAARAEAERRYPALLPDVEKLTYPRSALREHRRSAFVAGWEAARDHLAEQEASDAEVLAFREVAMDEGLLVGSSVARRILASVRDAGKEQER